ncbi:ABC-type glycerol-3-phosphate transport system, substrate-binding protein [Paenibacillus uliginis N3/975]|uniref:ABC-type glycerol-3-phosphate transport system, substrate-binding protein n=1 Tax=Paenibacillus uliginis N3/975 TaxID=1313296 RepID=A0A1X7H1B0_9BACL|nr:stalk domain-containing protein [Paenibacillus uliginis]SMF78089.1 ABC-type glycerol-3-phosphate transport system, substrate-binding protein [Paenibacillus uliginis N3/975]
MGEKYSNALSRPLKMLTVLALTAALSGSFIGTVQADRSPWEYEAASMTKYGPPTSVYFDNLNIYVGRQPINHKGTVMVQAEPLLKSLGYQVTWDVTEKKLTAEQAGKVSLTFWAQRTEAEIDGQSVHTLPAAPFVHEDQLWIPLRFTAQSCGLAVTWTAKGSFVSVRDPNAQIHLRVGTQADNENTGQPSALIQYMKENWETNVQINLTSPKDFSNKTKVKIAAGDMDSLMLLGDAYEFRDDLLESIALDLSESLQSYPSLKELTDASNIAVRKIGGKVYGIPRPSDLNDAPFPALRQDWIDTLGSKQPVTMDEMFNLLKQFVNKDPDGNGKGNTIGMYGYVNANNLGSLAWVEHTFTGSPERFSISESGTVVDHALSKGQRQALEWLTRAYAQGLINKDFATIDPETAMEGVKKKNVGLAVLKFDEAAKLTLDKQGSWTPLSGLKASSNAPEIAPWNSAGGGMYIVSRMAKVDAVKVLEWLDRGIEMSETGKWAEIEGLKEGDRSAIQNLFGRNDLLKSNALLNDLAPETQKLYKEAATRWHNISYKGQTLPEANLLWSQGQHTEFIHKLNDMKIKVIMGKVSLSEWDEYVKKMASSEDYKTMIRDFNKLIHSK